MSNFAENLRTLRKSAGLTQSDLAEKLFTSPQTVSRWESGDGEPSLDMLISLAQLLDVSADRLVSGKTVPEAELFDGIAQYIADMPAETADRDDTPRMFAMYDSLSGESDAVAQADLTEIFAALSDETVIRAVLKMYEIPYNRMYDAESLADILTVPETEIAKVIESLKTLGQLAESAIPYNGGTVTVYTRAGKQNVRMLLSLTRLLCRCGTDGNM